MLWTDSIQHIYNVKNNNSLVIFVGSGVSINSGILSWKELIKRIAKELRYEKCLSCSHKDLNCPKNNCFIKEDYSRAEYLRIPEYYYQKDKTTYENFIKNNMDCKKKSNPIDEEILEILPKHIITTNFDHLLETTKSINTKFYTIIREDSDLLKPASGQYIVKMHGDIDNIQKMVLKESDYINYEQDHPLISTFLRSLLFNHTILFLGYSLNDYNLNLIIGWINYFQKGYGIKNVPQNIFISMEDLNEYEVKRLEEKSIFPISISDIPDNIESKSFIPKELKDLKVKKLFYYLYSINNIDELNSNIPWLDNLSKKYKMLSVYGSISHEDFLAVSMFGRTDIIGDKLVFYNPTKYKQIATFIDRKENIIIETFHKANIASIYLKHSHTPKKDLICRKDDNDEIFNLYLDNKYKVLLERLKVSSNVAQKIYYYSFLGRNYEEILQLDEIEESNIKTKDFISILLHKMRSYLVSIIILYPLRQRYSSSKRKDLERFLNNIPAEYKNSVKNIYKLFSLNRNDFTEMQRLLNLQEQRNEFNAEKIFVSDPFLHILKLQTFAYDYYFYIKRNNLPREIFGNSKEYLSYYVKAILCSYSPVKSIQGNNIQNLQASRKPYPLNEIDFDIFTKYTTSEVLISSIKKYSVQSLILDENIIFLTKYKNFCESFEYLEVKHFINQFYNLIILSCLIAFDNKIKQKILQQTVILLKKLTKVDRRQIYWFNFMAAINYLVDNFSLKDSPDDYADLLDTLLILEKDHNNAIYLSILNKLAPYERKQTRNLLDEKINLIPIGSTRSYTIFIYRNLISMDKYRRYLIDNIEFLSLDYIYILVMEKIIPYSSKITNIFISRMEELKEKSQKDMTSLTNLVNTCLIFYISNLGIDLEILKPYRKYSEQLQFILDPEGFDYKSIDTSDSRWQYLIFTKKYQQYFVNHKKEILSNDLKYIFSIGNETRNQQKIVYGILLKDMNEIQNF